MLFVESYVVTASTTPVLQDKRAYLEAPPELKKALLKRIADSPEGMNWRQFYELTVSSKNQDLLFHPITERILAKSFYHGTRLARDKSTISKKKFERLKSPLRGSGITIDPVQLESLEKIIALLKARGIKAVFVESPMPGRTERDPVFSKNKQFLREEVIEKAGFVYIDGAVGFDVDDYENFLDAGHLSAKGRKRFTRMMARKLAELAERPDESTTTP